MGAGTVGSILVYASGNECNSVRVRIPSVSYRGSPPPPRSGGTMQERLWGGGENFLFYTVSPADEVQRLDALFGRGEGKTGKFSLAARSQILPAAPERKEMEQQCALPLSFNPLMPKRYLCASIKFI